MLTAVNQVGILFTPPIPELLPAVVPNHSDLHPDLCPVRVELHLGDLSQGKGRGSVHERRTARVRSCILVDHKMMKITLAEKSQKQVRGPWQWCLGGKGRFTRATVVSRCTHCCCCCCCVHIKPVPVSIQPLRISVPVQLTRAPSVATGQLPEKGVHTYSPDATLADPRQRTGRQACRSEKPCAVARSPFSFEPPSSNENSLFR